MNSPGQSASIARKYTITGVSAGLPAWAFLNIWSGVECCAASTVESKGPVRGVRGRDRRTGGKGLRRDPAAAVKCRCGDLSVVPSSNVEASKCQVALTAR